MISFRANGQRFQLRVAAIEEHEGYVLLYRTTVDDYWALPGGRVELGEDAASAIVREMREELAEQIRCGKLLIVVENFFDYAGEANHEIGLYYSAALSSESRLLDKMNLHQGVEGSQNLEFRWFPVAQLASVDLRPAFLKAKLGHLTSGVEHVVERG